MDGILLIDKPGGKTSHDVVAAIRQERGVPRAGHAGTLDPSATGLLIVALGKGLRLLEFMQGHDKTYEFSVELGTLTDTDDADGTRIGGAPIPTPDELRAAAARLTGEILQQPPRISAVKVAGRRLYQYAREGQEVTVPDRKVTVHELTLLSYEPPQACFRARGSKGLYVRSIARDLGGHVTKLRRTVSGPFRVEDAGPDLLPIDVAVMHLPEVRLSTDEAHHFENGRAIVLEAPPLARVYCGPRFIGIGTGGEGGFRPRKVILA